MLFTEILVAIIFIILITGSSYKKLISHYTSFHFFQMNRRVTSIISRRSAFPTGSDDVDLNLVSDSWSRWGHSTNQTKSLQLIGLSETSEIENAINVNTIKYDNYDMYSNEIIDKIDFLSLSVKEEDDCHFNMSSVNTTLTYLPKRSSENDDLIKLLDNGSGKINPTSSSSNFKKWNHSQSQGLTNLANNKTINTSSQTKSDIPNSASPFIFKYNSRNKNKGKGKNKYYIPAENMITHPPSAHLSLGYDYLATSSLTGIQIKPYQKFFKKDGYIKRWWIMAKKWNLLNDELRAIDLNHIQRITSKSNSVNQSITISAKLAETQTELVGEAKSNNMNSIYEMEVELLSNYSPTYVSEDNLLFDDDGNEDGIEPETANNDNISNSSSNSDPSELDELEEVDTRDNYQVLDDEGDKEEVMGLEEEVAEREEREEEELADSTNDLNILQEYDNSNSLDNHNDQNQIIDEIINVHNNKRMKLQAADSKSSSEEEEEEVAVDSPDSPDQYGQSAQPEVDSQRVERDSTKSRRSEVDSLGIPYEEIYQYCEQHRARVICIGDVHGCIEEVLDLLRHVSYRPGDLVLFLGDLVAKGPNSAAVVNLAVDLDAASVRGNHDHEVIRQGVLFARKTRAFNTFDRSKVNSINNEHLKIALQLNAKEFTWLSSLPYYIRAVDLGTLFVHAGFVSGQRLPEQDPWSMMTMRSLLPDGKMSPRCFYEYPWAKNWTGPLTTVFGHDAARGLQTYQHAIGLDTGCVYGGELTALILPEKRLVSVPAKKAYQDYGKSRNFRVFASGRHESHSSTNTTSSNITTSSTSSSSSNSTLTEDLDSLSGNQSDQFAESDVDVFQ